VGQVVIGRSIPPHPYPLPWGEGERHGLAYFVRSRKRQKDSRTPRRYRAARDQINVSSHWWYRFRFDRHGDG
jgi:hypothetical protein